MGSMFSDDGEEVVAGISSSSSSSVDTSGSAEEPASPGPRLGRNFDGLGRFNQMMFQKRKPRKDYTGCQKIEIGGTSWYYRPHDPLPEVPSGSTVLMHGTTAAAAKEITESGFKLPSARSANELTYASARITRVYPHMFGKGVYFTTDRKKARNFGDVILVCHVDLGKTRVVQEWSEADWETTGESLEEAGGYHSLLAPKGTPSGGNRVLVSDEYVIFDPDRATVFGQLA